MPKRFYTAKAFCSDTYWVAAEWECGYHRYPCSAMLRPVGTEAAAAAVAADMNARVSP